MAMRRTKSKSKDISICTRCGRETGFPLSVCPFCNSRVVRTDNKFYEVAKLLEELNLKPLGVTGFWSLDKVLGVGFIRITVKLAMPYAAEMFSGLRYFEFYNDKNNCTLQFMTGGIECSGSAGIIKIFTKLIKLLKDWCEDYKANYEARWAVGKLAGWLD